MYHHHLVVPLRSTYRHTSHCALREKQISSIRFNGLPILISSRFCCTLQGVYAALSFNPPSGSGFVCIRQFRRQSLAALTHAARFHQIVPGFHSVNSTSILKMDLDADDFDPFRRNAVVYKNSQRRRWRPSNTAKLAEDQKNRKHILITS
jgi:hypothetical protein